MSCPSLETVAQWCLGELPEPAAQDFEQHYFGCDACLEQARRMQRLLDQLQASLPPLLTAERRRALEQEQPRLASVRVRPGERATLRMSEQAPFGLWLLQASVARLERVDFEARDPGGRVLFRLDDVPFDVGRGEVVLACQLHYRGLGNEEMHVRLTGVGPNGRQELGAYILDHQFESL